MQQETGMDLITCENAQSTQRDNSTYMGPCEAREKTRSRPSATGFGNKSSGLGIITLLHPTKSHKKTESGCFLNSAPSN